MWNVCEFNKNLIGICKNQIGQTKNTYRIIDVKKASQMLNIWGIFGH